MKLFHVNSLLLLTSASAFLAPQPRSRTNSLNAAEIPGFDSITLTIKHSLDDITSGLKTTIGGLDNFNNLLDSKYEDSLKALLGEIQTIFSEEQSVQVELSKYVSKFSEEIDQWLLNQNPDVESLYKQILDQISSLTINSPEALALAAFMTYTVVSSALTWGQPPPPSKPYPLQRYDPIAAQVFFDGKPVEAVARGLEIALKSLRFAVSLLKDKAQNQWEQNEEIRGMELAQLLTDLGPTFIKSE
jgi:hypothetical protein